MRGDQVARIIKLINMLAAHPGGLTVAQIASNLGCSLRTAYRDVHTLEIAEYPLYQEKVEEMCFWRLVDGFRHHISIPFTREELLALSLAKLIMPSLSGSVFARYLKRAVDKIITTLDPERTKKLSDDTKRISIDAETALQNDHHEKILDVIRNAMHTCETIYLVYKTPNRKKLSKRMVDPHRLHISRGGVYLIGFCHMREAVRTFSISRIKLAGLTGKYFNSQCLDTTENWLSDAFWAFKGKAKKVVLQFDPQAAAYLREKRWHSSQKLEDCEDGSLTMHLSVNPGPDLEAWLRSWGSRVRVIEPKELALRIAKELQKTAIMYNHTNTELQTRTSGLNKETKNKPSPLAAKRTRTENHANRE